MDSKLKRLTILAAVLLIIVTGITVLLLNTKNNTKGIVAGKQTSSTETESDTIYENGQIGNDLSAFLQDDTFFDQDKNEYLEELYASQNRLSLIITSVEKDLRIQVVDDNNNPVTGESFFIELNDKDEYKDLDKDGVIYIGDLHSGEYEVSLKPVEGYHVPLSSTKVRVKDKVEYTEIDDISLLIKSEAEIDALAEDTIVEMDDADKTEIKRLQAVSGTSSLGIDVSKWQKEIDWDKVKKVGIDFAIIRCGYRGSSTGSLIEDPYYVDNIKGAIAAGVKVGVYFFSRAANEVEAVEEASMVLDLIQDYNLTYPVFFDAEGSGGLGSENEQDSTARTVICKAFCETIESAGYESGVYASRNQFYHKLDATDLEKYVIWLAEYRSVPLYQGYYQMWQYTCQGKIDGINGNVDVNIAYLGY